jgi:hypothetical protein
MLQRLLRQKDIISNVLNHMRTEMVRFEQGRPSALFDGESESELRTLIHRLLATLAALDEQITPLIENEGAHVNRYWGYMSRAGHADKSHLMRQIEKYADIYMSRVSNMLKYTPYMYYRNTIQTLAHDQPVESALEVADRIIASASQLTTELDLRGSADDHDGDDPSVTESRRGHGDLNGHAIPEA